MPDTAHELLWQRVVAALRTRVPSLPADAGPDVALSLPESELRRDVNRFLTDYYYPTQYGASDRAIGRLDAESLVARIESACTEAEADGARATAGRGLLADARGLAKYLLALFVMLALSITFGFGPKSQVLSNGWMGLYVLVTMGVLVSANPSWRQLGLVAASLLVLFGVPGYWDHAYGELPVLWGTDSGPGIAPKAIIVGTLAVWFAGALVPALRQATSGRAATASPSTIPEAADPAGGGRPIWAGTRIGLLAIGLLCLAGGVASLSASLQTTVVPHTITIPGVGGPIFSMPARTQTTLLTRRRPENGINFASGMALVLAGLLALNRASKRRRGDKGAIDRLLDRAALAGQPGDSMLPLVPAAVAVVAFVWFGYLLAMRTDIHWSADDAVQAMAAAGLSNDLYVTGNLIYGVADDGSTTHVAQFTPALVRAIDRAEIGVGAFVRDFEYPMPGLLPILFLLALSGARAMQMRRGRAGSAPWLVASGVLNLYVLAWLVSGQRGVLYDGGVHPGWAVDLFGVLLPASLIALAAIHRKAETPSVPTVARSGWMSLYYLSVLAPVGWSYFSSDAAAGSPVLLWILAYLSAACLAWCLMLPDGRGGRAA